MDSYSAHTQPEVTAWLGKRLGVHLHFTPTSASSLNLMERWFREITQKRIWQGAFNSVPDLVEAMMEYVDHSNRHAYPLVRHATIPGILAKVYKPNQALEALL